ncbi:antitermination protein NusG [Niastella vici]|uniref:Antitermination protein NusG n=1 Tax=Niastella vici TaxID=1703345 RepID=A0A1V9FRU9_9BACT|nr:UpxY family transcription antiterminator [Niastella vici]OQP61085.1 antitermination protein NusG [Niastella vici]
MNGFNTGWYLIYTRPRHEKKVYGQLIERSINSYLPLKKTLKTWHDRKKYVDEPLFPSYVFVQLENGEDYYRCMQTDGYLYYVRSGKSVARINDALINNLKLTVNDENEIQVSERYFEPGKQLTITRGVLAGLSCEVVRHDGKEKLLVRVELLNRSVLMTLPEKNLIAI